MPGGSKHGIFTAKNLKNACEMSDVALRDPNKPVALYYTSEPKVRRRRQIVDLGREDQIKGIERTGIERINYHGADDLPIE